MTFLTARVRTLIRELATPLFVIAALHASSATAGPYAYVPVACCFTVSVIDTATNTIVAGVPAPTGPIGVAVSPNGMRVYVASQNAHSMLVIDAMTNTSVGTLPLASDPFSLAVTPDGARVYVALSGNNTVAVVNAATMTLITTVSVGASPRGVVVTPDGSKAYVTNQNSSTVSVIDTASNTVIGTIVVGSHPSGIAVNPSGTRVYVGNNGSSVSVINTTTDTNIATIPLAQASGVAVAPNGTVYASNGNNVSVINPLTNTVTATIPVGTSPYGISVTHDGARVYAVNVGSANVSVIDTATNTTLPSIPLGGGAFAMGNFIGPPLIPRAPVLTSAATQSGEIQLTFTPGADNGSSISGYTATCGPASTGGAGSPLTVSGLTNGTSYACSVTATNGVGTGPSSNTLNVTPGVLPAITSSAPPGGTVGTSYSHDVTATGTPTPTLSVSSGALPAGLTMNASGQITGTPTAAQKYNGTIAATNGVGTNGGSPATQNFSITIAPMVPIANDDLLVLLEDTIGNGTLTSTNDGTATYSIVAQGTKGTANITNAATGAYSYTPTGDANGNDSFTFEVNDGGVDSNVATISVTITAVNDAPSFTSNLTGFTYPAQTSGAQPVTGWAFGFIVGPANESAQSVAGFPIDETDPNNVVGAIGVSTGGDLSFTLTGASGVATFQIRMQDTGGTLGGGVDVSVAHPITITVRPGADIQVSKSNFENVVVNRRDTVYTIQMMNAGPASVGSVHIVDTLPATLTNALWTCTSVPSSLCPNANGAGSIDQTTSTIPNGALLEYTLVARVSPTATGFVTNSVTATSLDSTVTEIGPSGNNSATDTDPVLDDGLFIDGFENAGSSVLRTPILR